MLYSLSTLSVSRESYFCVEGAVVIESFSLVPLFKSIFINLKPKIKEVFIKVKSGSNSIIYQDILPNKYLKSLCILLKFSSSISIIFNSSTISSKDGLCFQSLSKHEEMSSSNLLNLKPSPEPISNFHSLSYPTRPMIYCGEYFSKGCC